MSTKGLRFCLSFLTHILIFYFVNSIYLHIVAIENESIDYFFILLNAYFFLCCFFWLWFTGYNKDAFYFFSNFLKIIRGCLLLYYLNIVGVPIFIIILKSFFKINYIVIENPPQFLLRLLLLIALNTFAFCFIFFLQYLWLLHLRKLGYIQKNLLFVGEPDKRFPLDKLKENRLTTYLGHFTKNKNLWNYLGPLNQAFQISNKELKSFILKNRINEVIIFLSPSLSARNVDELIFWLREQRINYFLVPEYSKISDQPFRPKLFPYIPFLESFRAKHTSLTMLSLKRIFDLTLSILLLF